VVCQHCQQVARHLVSSNIADGIDNVSMKIKLGCKVRSIGGVEGKVILLSADRLSVKVKVPGIWRGTGLVWIPLVRLSPIASYTPKPDQ
jgi:hypothetical protein